MEKISATNTAKSQLCLGSPLDEKSLLRSNAFRTEDKYSLAGANPKRGRCEICRTTGGWWRTIYLTTIHSRYGRGYFSSPTTGGVHLYP